MKKKKRNYKVTHIFADGRAITHEEFMAIAERDGGFYIDLEKTRNGIKRHSACLTLIIPNESVSAGE